VDGTPECIPTRALGQQFFQRFSSPRQALRPDCI
jgi:hypothetical protein